MLYLSVVLCGVAAMPVVFSRLEHLGGWVVLPCVGVFVVAFTLAVWVANLRKRGRCRSIGERLLPMGYEFIDKPSDGLKEQFFAPYVPLAEWMNLKTGSKGIEWMAIFQEGSEGMRLFEYEFTTGSGKSTQIHIYTVVAWPASGTGLKGAALGNLAGFRAAKMSWWWRRVWKKRSLDLPEYGHALKKWVFTGNAETGRRFLNDAVMRELASSPMGESWFIGGGWVCCLCEDPLDAENVLRFVERARGVFRMAG